MVEGRREAARWARDIIVTVVLLPTLLLWLGMTPPQVIIIALCALALVKAWEHGRLGITVVALSVGALMLGWDLFYYGTILMPPAAPTVIAPPNPAPPPQQSPPPPPQPWVNEDEIEQQHKLGRSLIPYSPEELLKLWVAGYNINIYQYAWLKMDYKSDAVPYPETIDKKQYYVIRMRVNSSRLMGASFLFAYFEPKKFGDQIKQIKIGGSLKAFCQFETIQQSNPLPPFNIRADELIAYNCDLN